MKKMDHLYHHPRCCNVVSSIHHTCGYYFRPKVIITCKVTATNPIIILLGYQLIQYDHIFLLLQVTIDEAVKGYSSSQVML